MGGVFISYRREDSAAYAGRLFDILSAAFGADNTFMDVDDIKGGDDFTTVIERKLGMSDAMVAVIGPHWVSATGDGKKRLENPNDFVIDRVRPRHHMSFGFGVHRCVGNRVAEMQLTIIWEEILKRFPKIELVGEPVRSYSSFIHGFESMQALIPSRT